MRPNPSSSPSPDPPQKQRWLKHPLGGWLKCKSPQLLAAVWQWLPVLVGLGATAVSLYMWRVLTVYEQSRINQEIASETTYIRGEIEEQIETSFHELIHIADYWNMRFQPAWELKTRHPFLHLQGYQAVAWISPGFKVHRVVPLLSNAPPPGLVSLIEQQRIPQEQVGMRADNIFMVITNASVGGQKQYLIFVPSFQNETFNGFVVGAFQPQELLSAIWQYKAISKTVSSAVFEGDQEIFSRYTQYSEQGSWGERIDLGVNNIQWYLQAWLEPEQLQQRTSLIPEGALIMGLMMALLLTLTTYLAQTKRQRAKQVESINQDLKRQIAERQRAEAELQQAKDELAMRVEQRTAEFKQINAQLQYEILEHQHTEAALRQSELKFQKMAANVPGMIYQFLMSADSSFAFSFVSLGCYEIFELTPEQICQDASTIISLLHASDQPRFYESVAVSAQTLQPWNWEGRCVTPSGKLKWVRGVSRPEQQENGDILWDGVLTDISDRKQAEAALQESEQKYRYVVENLQEVIFQTDASGLWTFLNPAWTDMTEFTVAESLGTNFLDHIYPEDQEYSLELFRALITGKQEIYRHEVRHLTKSGGYRWIEVFARVLLDADGRVVGSSGTVNDVTQRKQAEIETHKALEKAKELSALKSRFVSMMSHEFRTPLTTILMSAELLENYGRNWPEEKQIHHLKRIQTSVKNMTQLLNDVLLIGKAEANKLEFQPVPMHVATFCKDLVEELQLTAGAGHLIQFVCHTPCPTADFDEKLLRHIFGNLLSNAIKYSPQGGIIQFDLICNSETAIFRVQDRGMGIPPEDQPKLFEAFHRASNVGTISGTGLGMAIVKKSVDLHGGTIAVTSEVGVGTTFMVVLPLGNPSGNLSLCHAL